MKPLPKLLATGALSVLLLAHAPAQAQDMTETARAQISAFVEAVIAGPDAVATLLAPEYQIMRSNGVGYDRDGYINRGAGTVRARPDYAVNELVATADGDVMVARYFLEISETIGGQPVTRRAPRLTVFRNIDGAWKVSAHGNFARIE